MTNYFGYNKIFYPLKKLANFSNALSAGKFDTDITINSKDEIGELSLTMDLMRINLRNMIKGFKETDLIRTEL